MTKVLLFSHEFPPKVGGAGMVAYDIANSLTKKNIQVTAVTNNYKNSKAIINSGFRHLEVKILPKMGPYFYWKKLKEMNIGDYDKIIINDIGAALTASLFFPVSIQKKSIIYLHGSEPEKIFKSPSVFFKILKFKERYIKLLNNAHSIVAVSEYMKNKMYPFLKDSSASKKVKVIYNGINLDEYEFLKTDIRNKYNIGMNKKIILSAGRVVVGKGYKEMYEIFRDLLKQGFDYHWILVGDGDYLRELKRLSLGDNINTSMTFVGKLERRELNYFYSAANIFWSLSNYEESLGLVYIESIASGTPVIARKKGGALEVITEKTGYLIENNDECLKLLKTVQFKKLSLNTVNEALEKFNLENNINELIGLIKT